MHVFQLSEKCHPNSRGMNTDLSDSLQVWYNTRINKFEKRLFLAKQVLLQKHM